MKRVVIVQELLAQYRVPFYQQLRAILAQSDIELSLVYGQASGARALRGDESTLIWATPVKNRNLNLGRDTSAVWQPAVRHIRNADLVVVEHANRQLVNYFLLSARALGFGPKIGFWGHGANLQAANPHNLAERFKRWTAQLPDWWFVYTDGSADRIVRGGFPRDRVTVVQNAIDTTVYDRASKGDKQASECVFVGSLHKHKRIDFLLEAGQHIADQLPDFRLTVLGDGPLRPTVERAAARTPWLSYHGAVFGEDKAKLVSRASLMLMPGLVGLAILDAFAGNTPLVTTAIPYHSPEFEYAIHGNNAVVLPEDVTALKYARQVAGVLMDSDLLGHLRAHCEASRAQITVDEMAQRYASGLLAAIQER